VDKDEDYIRTVAQLGVAVEDLVKQNNVVDIYEEFFTGVATDHSAEVPNVKTITVFKDPHSSERCVRSAAHTSWHPDPSVHKVVVSYSIMQVREKGGGACMACMGCCMAPHGLAHAWPPSSAARALERSCDEHMRTAGCWREAGCWQRHQRGGGWAQQLHTQTVL
jgi:hypothetical protein